MEQRAVVVVSFGTSYLDVIEKNIVPIERTVAASLPERTLRRAFTSGIIRKKLQARDGVTFDGVPEALNRLLAEGFSDVVLQPTHLMHGAEYEKLCAQAEPHRGSFRRLAIGRPLLSSQEDYLATARAVMEELPAREPGTALLFMGHGTQHFANPAYTQLEYVLRDAGRTDAVIGTVEGYPGLDEVLRRLHQGPEVKKVKLFPLMVVAGDHAQNDLAGPEPDSWKSRLEAEKFVTESVLRGLGEYRGIRALFARHALEAAGKDA